METEQEVVLLPLTVAGDRLPVSADTLRRWVRNGVRGRRLKATRIGGRLYVSRRTIDAFIASISDDVEPASDSALSPSSSAVALR